MLCAQAWKPSTQHAGEKRGVADLLLGRTERAARAALVCLTRLSREPLCLLAILWLPLKEVTK